jgi:hypothetical protein
LPRSTSLWKSSPVNPWHAMFGIFRRCYIRQHDSMQCFSIFLNFLNSLALFPDLAQTRAAFDVCQVGWEPKLCVGSRAPHPQGTSMYFFQFFGSAFLVAPVQNWI